MVHLVGPSFATIGKNHGLKYALKLAQLLHIGTSYRALNINTPNCGIMFGS